MTVRAGRWAAVIASCVALAGCVQNAAPVGPVPAGIVPVPPGSAYRGAVGAVAVPGGGGAIPTWASDLTDGPFQGALDTALRQAGILAPGGGATLEAVVLDVAQLPSEPSTTKVSMSVRYRLIDATGRTLLERRVSSGYTATLAQAVQGYDRLGAAKQGAMRQNIEVLLRELGSGTAAGA